jgi:hypothetical protein
MPIDTGAFVAGVGILTTLDVLTISAIISLSRAVGEDPVARERSKKALKQAREADAECRVTNAPEPQENAN